MPAPSRRPTRTSLRLRVCAAALVLASGLSGCAGASGGGEGEGAAGERPSWCEDLTGRLRAVPTRQIHVNVYNSGGRKGEAARVADELAERGFSIIQTSNDPRERAPAGPVEIRYGRPGTSIARTLAQHVDGATLVNDGRWDPSVDLVVGERYTGLVPLQPAKPGSFALNVYNTTSTPGLAQDAGKELRRRGFRVGTAGNDPQRSWWADDTAIVRHGPTGEPAARTVAAQVAGAKMVEDKRADGSVDLVLGARYKRLAPRAKATPEAVPAAAVTPDPRCAAPAPSSTD